MLATTSNIVFDDTFPCVGRALDELDMVNASDAQIIDRHWRKFNGYSWCFGVLLHIPVFCTVDSEFSSLVSNFYGLEAVGVFLVGIKSVVVFSGDRGSITEELTTFVLVAWCFWAASGLARAIREVTIKVLIVAVIACCNFLRIKQWLFRLSSLR